MKDEWANRWPGRTVVCIASGPSLTAADCELVRASGHPAIVTNTTFRLCPWADVLMGFDGSWWSHHIAEVNESFNGRRLTCSTSRVGVESLASRSKFNMYGNSGAAAVSLAVYGRPSKVVMIGFDAKAAPDGSRHWHARHPAPLSDAKSMPKWGRKFEMLAAHAKRQGCNVVNASRDTALKCFPRGALEDEL